MPFLFALTLFVSAALLFVVQPMVAKMVLPQLGGAAAVWSTCMVFFQGALLAGYAYAHLMARRLSVRAQVVVHAGLLILPGFFLPFAVSTVGARSPASGSSPAFWLLGLLVMTVGVPFFVVAATAPLLQRWFSATRHPSARDPYFLYGASNLGSMLALASYPFLLEPNFPLARQASLWAVGYALLAGLTLTCGVAVWFTPAAEPALVDGSEAPRPSARKWLGWIALAFVPASWMLGVTAYLSTDISPVPLLWVVPLALYLLTFVLAFASRPLLPHQWIIIGLPWAAVSLALVMSLGLVQPVWILVHLLAFFIGALACHGELAKSRPAPRDLTLFYLALAVGGVLGGIFNALIAPHIFNRLAEYPLVVVLACLLLSKAGGAPLRIQWRDMVHPLAIFVLIAAQLVDLWGMSDSFLGGVATFLASGLAAFVCLSCVSRPVRFALTLGAAWLASGLAQREGSRTLFQERNFFGVTRVAALHEGNRHRLFLGTTLQGEQDFAPEQRREPLTYYSRGGPAGQVFETLVSRSGASGVAVVGLGAGSLAAYAQPGQRWDFYEINPVVIKIARDPRYFSYLEDCRADSYSVILGDARLRLQEASPRAYGILVLDAFSSDAVPTHLLTREAIQLYRGKLTENGLLLFDITNRYLDLEAVVGALAADAGLACRVRLDPGSAEERQLGKHASVWAVMTARESDLGALAADPQWKPARVRPGEKVWTDDFSDLASHFMLELRLPFNLSRRSPRP